MTTTVKTSNPKHKLVFTFASWNECLCVTLLDMLRHEHGGMEKIGQGRNYCIHVSVLSDSFDK
jgi:hypothetical protein